jgi:hypothetical protein
MSVAPDDPAFDPVFDAFRACPLPRGGVMFTATFIRALQELRESGQHPNMKWDAFATTYARKTGRRWPETARA